MTDEKRADEETLPDTPLHGHQEGRALDEEETEGGPQEERSEGDEALGGPTPPASTPDEAQVTSGGGSTEGSEHTHDDTPPPDAEAGEKGLGSQTDGIEGGEKTEPRGQDRP